LSKSSLKNNNINPIKKIIKLNENLMKDIDSKPLNVSFDVSVPDRFPTPVVPKKAHLPGINVVMGILVVSLTTMGIGSLQSIFSDMGSWMVSLVFGTTGLSPMIDNIFIGVLGLGLAVIFLYWMGKWREIIPSIKESTEVLLDKEPREYFELKHIDYKYLIKEMKNRGCVISGGITGKGANIDCPTVPLTKNVKELINGLDEKYYLRHKMLQFIITNLISSVAIGIYAIGNFDPITGQWITTIIFSIMIYFQLGMSTIKLWGASLLYFIYISALWIFTSIETSFLYSIIAIGIILFVLALIAYVIRPDTCLNSQTWWCSIL